MGKTSSISHTNEMTKYTVEKFKILLTENANYISLISLFVLYFLTAPYTVQTGDTGELVTNSYFLRVSHPPGYPLWTLIYHLPVKFLPLLSPFHSAAMVTVLVSCLWLGILLFQKRSTENLLLVLVLATSLYHWRYSILPDVFALHLLFLTLVFLVFMKPELLEKWWMILLVSLSVANHHTIVFFFPLYVFALTKRFTWRKLVLSLVCGFASASLYLLLLTFHPDEYGSWDNLQNFTDVLHHFLRKSYGTFSLALSKMGETEWSYLIPDFILNYWSLLAVLGYVCFKKRKEVLNQKKRLLTLGLCLFTYGVVFQLFGSISLYGLGLTVFERFLLQPILTVFFLFLVVIWNENIKFPKWLTGILLINVGLNVIQNYQLNNYRENTVVEDYAINVLNSLPSRAIYHAIGDTHSGVSYYLHDIVKLRPDVSLIFSTAHLKWGYAKSVKRYPDIFIGKHPKLHRVVDYSKYSYYTNAFPKDLGDGFKSSYYGAIFNLYPDKLKQDDFNCSVSDSYLWRRRPSVSDLYRYDSAFGFDFIYGQCNFSQALFFLNLDDVNRAIVQLEKATALSPLSILYRERLCHLYKQTHHVKTQECQVIEEELIINADAQYYTFNI